MRKLLLAPFLAICSAGGSFGLAACSGRVLDIGSNTSDTALADSAFVDGGADVGAVAFHGLSLDDVACTITSDGSPTSAGADTSYTVAVAAECGVHGTVTLRLATRGDVSYPQTCGAFTSLTVEIEGEAGIDAGSSTFTASSDVGGSCAVATGPTTSVPNAKVSLTATVGNGIGRTFRVRYAPLSGTDSTSVDSSL